jgi:hypothetical protein
MKEGAHRKGNDGQGKWSPWEAARHHEHEELQRQPQRLEHRDQQKKQVARESAAEVVKQRV